MYWANFIHIYQPPTQTEKILRKVAEESYRKILHGLDQYPKAKLTLNINGGLTELFATHGLDDVIAKIRALLEKGQLELTESAMYHPFLPELPKDEIIRQIELNRTTNRRYFGPLYRPKGFFLPEMAYTRRVGGIVAQKGYQWMVLDEAAYPGDIVDPTKSYRLKSTRLLLYFRERGMSFKILSAQLGTGSLLLKDLGDRLQRNEYLLTAMDGETFGHHRLGLEQLLFDIYAQPDLPTVTISELPTLFPTIEDTEPLPSSWALMHKDQTRKEPMSRWNDPKNDIHRMQWRLTRLALSLMKKADRTKRGYAHARRLLDMALHSDQYWWASAKPWWSLEMIERGANDFVEAIRAMPGIPTPQKRKAEALYLSIVTTGFRWQRQGIVEGLVQEHYDEEVSQRLDLSVPLASEVEFQRIIQHLEGQMLAAAREREYDRASQFKRRIEELKSERARVNKEPGAATAHDQPRKGEQYQGATSKDWGI